MNPSFSVRGIAAAALMATALVAQAQTPPKPLSPADSDPVKMGWMVGSPPPPDKMVKLADLSHFRFPQIRWSFANMRQIIPSTNVARGEGPVAALPHAERTDLDGVSFTPLGQTTPMTWAQSVDANYTDSIVVLHKGRIVYEKYFGVNTAATQHISNSVTKSFFGTLGAMLVEEGKLDPKATVSRYIPELKDSAFGDATVRQVLDMTTGFKYSENYADPKADVWAYARAGSMFPRPPGYAGPQNFYEYLQTLVKEGEHGEAFTYKTPNSELMGWLIRRATGQTVGQALSERIWSKLGVEREAYLMVDTGGNEFAGGGFNLTARDMARFGEMMRLDGRYNGQQIVPKAVVDDIRGGGGKAEFAKAGYTTLPGWTYRDMWWVSHNEHGAYSARGIHGQALYIDPKAEMVIARFASHPLAANANIDPTSLPAYHALAKHLMKAD